MNWKLIYRVLVDIRRGLNKLIDFARARAYPNMARKKVEATENQPVLP